MTHATVLVIVVDAAGIEQVERTAAKMLAPYDENLDVEPYRDYPDEGELTRMRAWFEETYCYAPAVKDLADVMQQWHNTPGYVDEEGKLYRMSTYNPNSKWDWYQVGGRSEGTGYAQFAVDSDHPNHLRAEGFDVRRVQWTPYSVLTPDGAWHTQGRLGWFGVSIDAMDDEAWTTHVEQLLAPYQQPGVALLVVDYHI